MGLKGHGKPCPYEKKLFSRTGIILAEKTKECQERDTPLFRGFERGCRPTCVFFAIRITIFRSPRLRSLTVVCNSLPMRMPVRSNNKIMARFRTWCSTCSSTLTSSESMALGNSSVTLILRPRDSTSICRLSLPDQTICSSGCASEVREDVYTTICRGRSGQGS
jgi:hypothetical protein